ncbi:GGDEF domain-containing protein [Romboutsia lituseburensis]|uniref:GGDEF domain-containing protein n=1 Tax=Romboutsia lituseburensis TaxID=1537 RepID=UPI00215B5E53|nr:GGDEF domain-containing protein [Romboutsia lituseburensis]MCR8744897.1 GGDEF domain-containing protein [Romboutsia lituseburensis]
MNYEIIETYIDDLRQKDEYNITLSYIKEIQNKVNIFIENLNERNFYDYSKSYFLLFLTNQYKQNKKQIINNLKKAIKFLEKSHTEDEIYEAILYGYLSNYYIKYESKMESDKMFKIAREKLIKQQNKEELIQFYIRHINILMISRYDISKINLLIEELHLLIKSNASKNVAKYYLDLGVIYLNALQNTIVAIFYLSHAFDLAQKTCQIELEIKARIFLAASYYSLGNELESIKYIEVILKNEKYQNINPVYKAIITNNLITYFIKNEDLKSAKNYLIKFDDNINSVNKDLNEQVKMIGYICKAKYYSMSNENIDKGVKYINKSKSLYEKNKYKSLFQDIDILIDKIEGNLYYKVGKYDLACNLHKRGFNKSIKRSKNRSVIEFHKLLSKDYEKLQDYQKSIRHLKLYMELKEDWLVQQSQKYTEILLKENDILNKKNKISQLTELKNELIDKRNTDMLSGLLNRRFLNEYLECEDAKLGIETSNLYAFMIDIDFFKKYNDKYGHIKGDEVIDKIGKIIKNICVKDDNIAIRYGGEEFLILLRNIDYEDSIKAAKLLLQQVNELNIKHEDSPFNTTVSISIGIASNNYCNDYYNLIDNADKALYISKSEGGNQYRYFN